MPSNISLLIKCSDTASQAEQAAQYLSHSLGLTVDKILKNPDYHLINSDQVTEDFSPLTIEQVRDLTNQMVMRPFQGLGKESRAIYVICKIELASIPAQNALLKSLEEPPSHIQFLLTTTQPQRVLPTIFSRCQLVESDIGEVILPSSNNQIDLNKLTTSNYSDLIELTGQSKDKNEAISFLKELLNQLHRANIAEPTANQTKLMQATVLGLDYLGKNVNTRLVLEHVLFQFK